MAVWWRESAAGANPGPLLSTQLANKIYTRRKIPACHPASLRNIDGCTRQHARSNQVFHQIQLSLSSRAIHGGAYFSDVSGWNSILISVPGPCEVTEWHRLLGFCLMITFCLNPAQQAVSLWNCRVCWRICLFYLYGFVTAGKYLWSPRWEILQFQWQFQ